MLTLSILLFPILAALLVLAVGGKQAKQIAFLGALVELGLSGYAFFNFVPDATSQFAFDYPWVSAGSIRFSAGIDGVSLLLVVLTGFLTPLIILSAFRHAYERPAVFYSLILFMQAALMGVFTARDAFLFYL
jgi:NADH-quinone oxidoreductase subunit M